MKNHETEETISYYWAYEGWGRKKISSDNLQFLSSEDKFQRIVNQPIAKYKNI